MKECFFVDYIHFIGKTGQHKLKTQLEEYSGLKILHVSFDINDYRKWTKNYQITDKGMERLHRKLKRYKCTEAAIGAEGEMADWMGICDLQFYGRKQEMIENRKYIFDYAASHTLHKRFAIHIHSGRWGARELLAIYIMAKDYYEELYYIVKDVSIPIGWVKKTLFEEWGIVLHIISEENVAEQSGEVDFVLFLEENLSQVDNLPLEYHMGYVVSCREDITADICRRPATEEMKLLSGFCYRYRGECLPYQMAVDMHYQCPEFYEEKEITVVAICGLK